MTMTANRRGAFALRSRSAALALLALAAALLLTAALFRPAVSQLPPDPAADALPRLNLLGRHASEAAEYAKQIKARYAPTNTEYLDARSRYESAAEKFGVLVEALALSVTGNSGVHPSSALREHSRLAVEAADSFAHWADGQLQLLRRGRRPGGAPPVAAEVVEAAAALAAAYGPKDTRAKGRAVELMNELVKFKRWDEIPPVTPAATGASTPLPTPSPLASPPNP